MMKVIFVPVMCLVCVWSVQAMGKSEKQAFSNMQFDGISSVRIEGIYCDVEIEGTDSKSLAMKLNITDKKTKVKYSNENGVLRVRVVRDFAFFDAGREGVNTIRIEAPHGIDCKVVNGSGSVFVVNLKSKGLELRSASGRIAVGNCLGAKKLETSSGAITAINSDGDITGGSASGVQSYSGIKGSIDAHSTSGNLYFISSRGTIKAGSASGSISVSGQDGIAKASSLSGSITLEGVKGVIECKTVSGNIDGYGVSLTGDSRFESGSGQVSVGLDNLIECRLTISSTSGALEAGSSKGSKRLETGDGSIRVYAVTVSGAIRFK